MKDDKDFIKEIINNIEDIRIYEFYHMADRDIYDRLTEIIYKLMNYYNIKWTELNINNGDLDE